MRMADLAAFNTAPAGQAERELLAACASKAYAATMLAGRPYPSPDRLRTASDAAIAALSWDDILEAMSAHPRIGARVTGASAAEQSGVADADRQALAGAGAAYEQRFGHVFLIRASGRTGQEMLAEVRARLSRDQISERAVVRRELTDITRLRLTRLLGL
jgi:2-oxo-4-hydroxy-4-carboxy-5-ureidoimidazoline decarboxylase